MAGSTLGKYLTLTTFGESHGTAIGGVLDGFPSGVDFPEEKIQRMLARRRPGQSRFVSARREKDEVQILSGVYEGKTLGTPIAFMIPNADAKSSDYDEVMNYYRPGHADYAWDCRYGRRDPRGGGRSSARLTAPIVVAGALAIDWLERKWPNFEIQCAVTQIGERLCPVQNWNDRHANSLNVAVGEKDVVALEQYLIDIRSEGDSVGAKLEVCIQGVPAGLGETVFDKLDARLAYVLMGLNAVKGVSIGDGFETIAQKGSQQNDIRDENGWQSNHAGGIQGGLSNAQPIKLSLAFKPTPSIAKVQVMMNDKGQEKALSIKGRHDPCVGIRAVPVVESLLALTLMDIALGQP